jgi:hypothetical protein
MAVDDDTPSHGYQPRPYRSGCPVQLLGIAPGTYQRFLDDVLGTVAIARHQSENVGEKWTGVLSVKSTHQVLIGC